MSEVCYDTLDMLVRHGVGWKELYFLAYDSTFLAYDSTFLAYEHDSSSFFGGARFLRVPKPGNWQRALEERDGATSNASVEIYLATLPHPCSVLLQPATRTRSAQALPPRENPQDARQGGGRHPDGAGRVREGDACRHSS
jgi:hypothetical protein